MSTAVRIVNTGVQKLVVAAHGANGYVVIITYPFIQYGRFSVNQGSGQNAGIIMRYMGLAGAP